jgi:hypothetical protein
VVLFADALLFMFFEQAAINKTKKAITARESIRFILYGLVY